MNNIIEFGTFKAKQISKHRVKGDCQHKKMVYSNDDETIQCEDCNAWITPYSAFRKIIQDYETAWSRIKSERESLEKLRELTLANKVLQGIQKIWNKRKNKMAVCCPHCDKAILPKDNLGGRTTSLEFELKRRQNNG